MVFKSRMFRKQLMQCIRVGIRITILVFKTKGTVFHTAATVQTRGFSVHSVYRGFF